MAIAMVPKTHDLNENDRFNFAFHLHAYICLEHQKVMKKLNLHRIHTHENTPEVGEQRKNAVIHMRNNRHK